MLTQASREDILYKDKCLMAVVYWLLELLIHVHPHQSQYYGLLNI